MAYDFSGKRILVTGAGQGIGKAIVLALAKAGAKVVAVSKTQANLDQLAVEVPGVETISVDLSDWDATRAALAGVGPVDGLVNNAGVAKGEPFLEMTKENFDRTIALNLGASINVSQIIAKGMVTRSSGGSIVNVSSVSSMAAVPGLVPYASSKAGLDQATKVMALELGPHNIRVNCVNPSAIRTAMSEPWFKVGAFDPILARTPLGEFGEPEDVADTVLFLLSDKARLITGIALPIDGGLLTT